jgi:hypothetical protein
MGKDNIEKELQSMKKASDAIIEDYLAVIDAINSGTHITNDMFDYVEHDMGDYENEIVLGTHIN